MRKFIPVNNELRTHQECDAFVKVATVKDLECGYEICSNVGSI